MESIDDKIARWGLSLSGTDDPDIDYLRVYTVVEYLAKKRFYEYHPTAGPSADFLARLGAWLDKLPDEKDQKLLLRLVPRLFFIGPQEFKSLYRVALNGHIERWLIDQESLSLDEAAFGTGLRDAMSATWFCPITDSMQIAEFYHVNQISGPDYRPDWRSMETFGDAKKLSDFMIDEGLMRLVLLEDFVGTGSQMKRSIEFAANLPNKPEILVVPLIICPKGAERGRQLAISYSNVSFTPVLELREQAFIAPTPKPEDEDFIVKLRELITRTYHLVANDDIDYSNPPYGPYGFKNTGGLVIMYTNCPNNTLPAIHHESSTWQPLFPRSSRLAI